MIGKYAAFAAGMAGTGSLVALSRGDWLSGAIVGAISIACIALTVGADEQRPEGFVLAPLEPTQAMYDALSATDKMWRELTSTEVYRVMISALSKEEGAA